MGRIWADESATTYLLLPADGPWRPNATSEHRAPGAQACLDDLEQRLKRVFAIDIDTCQRCGGRLKVIASIEDPELITNILSHQRIAGDPAHCTQNVRIRQCPPPRSPMPVT